jgi:predicted helicase
MPSLLPRLTFAPNRFITFSGPSHSKAFQTFLVDQVFSFDFLEKTTGVPFYTFDKDGNKSENITEWGLNQFNKQYKTKKITREDIFYYSYSVLHNPEYRKKYELNLKREFPRIPFYEDFFKWAKWGKELMELHLNYEEAKPFNLKQVDADEKAEPKVKLKADKEKGEIILDENTTLTGIPKEAWEYKLGNRSALEWVLDQYKEKKPSDPTIAEKFNTYKFADYKTQVIDLIKRVCTVSVETVKIVNQMKS